MREGEREEGREGGRERVSTRLKGERDRGRGSEGERGEREEGSEGGREEGGEGGGGGGGDRMYHYFNNSNLLL